jgi:hypothetical protein
MGSRSCVYGGDVTVECVVYFCPPNGDHGVEMREMRMWSWLSASGWGDSV